MRILENWFHALFLRQMTAHAPKLERPRTAGTHARTAPIGGRSNGAYKYQQVNSAHSKIRLVHEARAAAGDHAHREEGQAVQVQQEVQGWRWA